MDAEDTARTLPTQCVDLRLSAGIYARLIEELGFLMCVVGHQRQAAELRKVLMDAGGVTEYSETSDGRRR